MKKNLFLTLALAFAGFAGANAQEWSQTLGAGDGLPGENVQKGTTTVQVFKSDVIKPTEALTTLRFTVAQNFNGEKPNGNNFVTALSELVVYAADGTTVIPYTATSNADHNTLSGGTDGAGLAALNDDKWDNYWHSNWSSNAVAEFHHLELTFAEPISEFILEWGARPGNTKNAPTLVGLTPGGVDFVPYSDWAFTMGNEITSMDQLLGAKYFVMKSNVPETYDVYHNNTSDENIAFGTQTNDEPLVGPGPMYVKGNSQAEEAEPAYAIQLLPVDGGYYFYFVSEGKFLSLPKEGDGSWNGYNGVQNLTTKMSEAAVINIYPLENGRFEFSYSFMNNDVEDVMWLGATPSTGGSKNVNQERYDFYKEGHKYCMNYAYVITFDWTLQEVAMNYPKSYTAVAARNAVKEAKSIYAFLDSTAAEGYKEEFETFCNLLKDIDSKASSNSYDNVLEVFADVDLLNDAMGWYLITKVAWYSETHYNELVETYKDSLSSKANPEENTYSLEAFESYITNEIMIEGGKLMEQAFENPYAHVAEMKTFITEAKANIAAFLDTKISFVKFPIVYSSEDPHHTPLGKLNDGNHYDWEQMIALEKGKTVNGIRLTFIETNVGSAASDGKYKGYPMVALSGLEILDSNGNTLELTSGHVSTNSLETNEGSLENLFDNDVTSFYHSIWGGGTFSPEGYVYLDIQFPDGKELNSFTIKTIGRNNKSLAPGTVCVSNYGEVYDPLIFRENPYAVTMVKQITDVNDIKEDGIYIISGNLRAKTQNAAPVYFSGAEPYHTDVRAALNDPCVYMFKKVAGGWNIISLAKAQYWALNETENYNKDEETGETTTSTSYSTGLTLYPSNAAVVNFAKSNNIENAFVIYSNLQDNFINASWNWKNDEDSIAIAEATVNANKFVFMHWDDNLAGRPCVSELPGVFEHGLAEINNNAKAEDIKNGDGYAAGDHLHFNKANGEGEWNIYEVTMTDEYYLWANNIGALVPELGLITGKNPGCIKGDISAIEAIVENINAVVENEDKAGAKAAVEAFVENVALAQNAERVQVEDCYWYAIESAYPEYYNKQEKNKAIYATENGLAWKDAPASYNRGDEKSNKFIFQFKKYDGVNDPEQFGVPEAEAENVYTIYNETLDVYFGAVKENSVQIPTTDEFGAAVYVVKPLKNNIYTIYAIGTNPLHTDGHGNGGGTEGAIVYWEGGVNTCSSWTLRFVDDAEGTSINDLVVEKGEVVSVGYFTPAGAAIPAPVNGINIVVTVYSNGVIETKKVLVK